MMTTVDIGDGPTSPTTRYYGFALRLAFRYIGNMEKALAVTRDVLTRMNQENISINSEASYPRIQQLLINTSIFEALRSKNPVANTHPDIWEMPDDKEAREQAIFYRDLILLLISLPLLPRLLYNLCGIDGWPPAKAAVRLGISPSRAKTLLAKTRTMLKKKIKEIPMTKKLQ
jgi:DNA-directed RNA polymerase specialized sigma24 family protein